MLKYNDTSIIVVYRYLLVRVKNDIALLLCIYELTVFRSDVIVNIINFIA